MPAIEPEGPEASYRRGYQRGAADLFRALEEFLDPTAREIVRTWVQQDIELWQSESRLGDLPTWRIRKLKIAR